MANSGTGNQFAFYHGKIVPIAQATVSVMSHGLNYGTGVFGGLRGYWNTDDEQLYVFRPQDHFERFIQSAGLMRIEIPHTPAELTQIVAELLRAEGYRENCYVRPLAFKSLEGIGVRLHDIPDALAIWAIPFGRYIDKEEGAHVCFSAWRRVDDNAIPARGKISGSYANSALIKSDAVLAGYDEALVLNEDGHVSEASASNFFMVRKGVVYTPPISANVLEGITRRTVIQLLRDDLGIDVVEREIDRTEVYIADEAFLCGTGVQIAAITRIEHRPIGTGVMGEITTRVRDYYMDVVSGRVSQYRAWLSPVYLAEAVQ
ncbi:MAG: branched-chain amino acid transaminase [Armatimonadetes bacterium]|nr:branched-chain amino acid transaminase [Anaerolineae bacterium]